MGWMSDVVSGSVIGLDQNTPRLEAAMAGLGQAGEDAFRMQAAVSVPPSYEVSRYAHKQAAPQALTVIVENPWTGEQVEAKVKTVADSRIQTAVSTAQRTQRQMTANR